jgi:hypothetical protein
MAQTGYTPILIYSSSTAAAAPAAGSLTNSTLGSELAINITDGKLFYKDNANNVQVIGWKVVPTSAGGTGLTSFTANRVFYAGTTSTVNQSANLTFDGTTLTAANFTDSSLTSGRVTYAGTGGNLVDSANFTFDGTNANLAGSGAQLIIGFTSTPVSGASATVQGTAAGFAAVRYNDTASLQGYLNHYRSRGSTVGTPSGVLSGNGLGRYTTFGYNGTSAAYVAATEVRGEVDGSPGAADMPGRLIFATTAVGATSVTTRQTIFASGGISIADSTDPGAGNLRLGTGNLVIGTSGKGIDFSATPGTGTSELFADYEEGTWTPAYTTANANATVTYNNQDGGYTRIGRVVYFSFQINVATVTSAGTGAIYITGLPFTVNNSNWGRYLLQTSDVDFDTAYNQGIYAYMVGGQTRLQLLGSKDNAAWSVIVPSEWTIKAGSIFTAQGFYFV